MSTHKYVFDTGEAEAAAQERELDSINNYMVTTTYKLTVTGIVAKKATHFMKACNALDSIENPNHPVAVLRRAGYMVDLEQVKHKIVRED